MSGGPGVNVQTVQPVVIHHFEDMAVAADENPRSGVMNHLGDSRLIASGVASDMSHEHIYILDPELKHGGEITARLAVVYIAVDGSHHRAYLLQPADDIDAADVTRVPDFIAVLEMDREAVIPAGMSVGKDSYTFQCFCLRKTENCQIN